jgi:Tetratricopeptide repeat
MNRRAVEGYENALGKEHADTLNSVYYQRKRYDTASELYQRACDAYKRILSSQHPITVACCNDYSSIVNESDHFRGILCRSYEGLKSIFARFFIGL